MVFSPIQEVTSNRAEDHIHFFLIHSYVQSGMETFQLAIFATSSSGDAYIKSTANS